MTVGERIREERERQGLTRKALAEKTHEENRIAVAEITISQYETNRRKPQSVQLRQLADALGVTVDYLLTGQQQEEKPNAILTYKGKTLDEMTLPEIQEASMHIGDALKVILLNMGFNESRMTTQAPNVQPPGSGLVFDSLTVEELEKVEQAQKELIALLNKKICEKSEKVADELSNQRGDPNET